MIGWLAVGAALAQGVDPQRALVDAVAASDLVRVEAALGQGADPDAPVWVETPTSALGRLWQRVVGGGGRWTSGLYLAADQLIAGDAASAAVLERLLVAGGDPDVVIAEREPLLTVFARAAAVDTPIDAWTRRLLAAGADPDPGGASSGGVVGPVAALAKPRSGALVGDERDVVRTLIAAGPDVADHALCAAARAGDGALLAELLPVARQPGALCADGVDTPLLAAVRAGQAGVIGPLVAAGADLTLAAPPSWHAPVGLAVSERDVPREVLVALVAAGADRGRAEADGRTPFDLARGDRLAWLADPPLRPGEQASALAVWARRGPVPPGALPQAMTDGWTPDLLAPVITALGLEGWQALYVEAGPDVIGGAPHRMGVLGRALRSSALRCPLQDDLSSQTLSALLGPRLRRERHPPLRVDHLVGGDVTSLRASGRWEVMIIRPAPAACALLPYDLARSTRAEVEIALGPPDVRLADAIGWRLRPDDPGRAWMWVVEHDPAGHITGSRLDRRTP